ncbi:hypothetical protein [Pseudomonas eucalypticola]|uniref:Uncharacterized protein n=1 Tax=Pseudomonas eucalypticola TaxID=2599595 RepID=A0A7D5HC72_9PSED|nr:hypothetical protein [Pseudomonas eucalypticola]QKZ03750.1 hypothetical protein HWQ56_08120 [Pseudomonas eucalypticola]
MSDLIGSSFRARLVCVTSGHTGWVAPFNGERSLVLKGRQAPAAFFDFNYSGGDGRHFHYAITAASNEKEYADAAVEISANGYVGFYPPARTSTAWRLEVTVNGYAGTAMRFKLQDAEGRKVGVLNVPGARKILMGGFYTVNRLPGNIAYLKVGHGASLEFEVTDVKRRD